MILQKNLLKLVARKGLNLHVTATGKKQDAVRTSNITKRTKADKYEYIETPNVTLYAGAIL